MPGGYTLKGFHLAGIDFYNDRHPRVVVADGAVAGRLCVQNYHRYLALCADLRQRTADCLADGKLAVGESGDDESCRGITKRITKECGDPERFGMNEYLYVVSGQLQVIAT